MVNYKVKPYNHTALSPCSCEVNRMTRRWGNILCALCPSPSSHLSVHILHLLSSHARRPSRRTHRLSWNVHLCTPVTTGVFPINTIDSHFFCFHHRPSSFDSFLNYCTAARANSEMVTFALTSSCFCFHLTTNILDYVDRLIALIGSLLFCHVVQEAHSPPIIGGGLFVFGFIIVHALEYYTCNKLYNDC